MSLKCQRLTNLSYISPPLIYWFLMSLSVAPASFYVYRTDEKASILLPHSSSSALVKISVLLWHNLRTFHDDKPAFFGHTTGDGWDQTAGNRTDGQRATRIVEIHLQPRKKSEQKKENRCRWSRANDEQTEIDVYPGSS